MLHYTDATAGVAEKKSVRKEQRVKPSISATISRAAAAVGMDESAFIVSAAYEKAVEIEFRPRLIRSILSGLQKP